MARTWTAPRGFERKSYHSSVRVQWAGRLAGRGVGAVGDVDGGLLDRGMRPEVGADEPAVEGPVVLGVGGGVDPDPAAAVADVGAEGALPTRGEHVPGGAEEDDGVIAAQALGRERSRVLGRGDREAVRAAEAPDRRDSGWNRIVSESSSFGEHEHRGAGLRLRLRVARAGDQAQHSRQEQDRSSGRDPHDADDPRIRIRAH